MQPGHIVTFRDRLWVVLPAEEDLIALRPLVGEAEDVVTLNQTLTTLLGYTLPEERPQPAHFPPPDPDHVADAAGARLLWQAARLLLRESAAPLRSLGRIAIRPRLYQFVPLLMALRLDPVRLLIADDVGVGKTIEALLIARELWDRGEIRRLAVLCPPALCDQWQAELSQKCNLDAVVIRPGTLGQLERRALPTETIYDAFPVQVISIDWVKGERHRPLFLQKCPELVIVDEAHTAAPADARGQQQRFELVSALAAAPDRHLILLTATPHSGKPDTFRALLGLLHPDFADWDLSELSDARRRRLARHFVQRTRADLRQQEYADATPSTGDELPLFPRREARDAPYALSEAYRRLFEATLAFSRRLVEDARDIHRPQQRARYWSALTLLRCVMSSPAAAVTTLRQRGAPEPIADDEALDESLWRDAILESTDAETDDQAPTAALDQAAPTFDASEQAGLAHLRRLAEGILRDPNADAKLKAAIDLARELLGQGYAPIFWCRYVATAEYLAEALRRALPEAKIECVTGRQPDDERRARIARIPADAPRALVATDCLSEGINLHEAFDAVVHYDLPWNPNRLEQREGRVDRFGQARPTVVAVLMYGRDNAVDGAVLDVLLRKAREIHRALGVFVPLPVSGESVVEALTQALLLRGNAPQQLSLGLETNALHRLWDEATRRERESRSRFAQHALRPDAVRAELEATDAVLGDPAAVRDFVLNAAARFGHSLRVEPQRAGSYEVIADPHTLPEALREALPTPTGGWRISFDSPTPRGAEYVGRNHRFVNALARYLFEQALAHPAEAIARRAGAIATRAVTAPTALFVLRTRYLMRLKAQPTPLLAESVEVVGLTSAEGGWLEGDAALRLLEAARPDAELRPADKQAHVAEALRRFASAAAQATLREYLARRAQQLTESHRRLREAMRLSAGLEIIPPAPDEVDVLSAIALVPPP